MKESISNSFAFMLVIILLGACATVLMSSLAFSKTFKIKNRVVEIIEKHREFNFDAETEIDQLLKTSGYPTVGVTTKKTCPVGRGADVIGIDGASTGKYAINTIKNYKYCVYEYKTVKGNYYSVAVFMKVQLPMIGDIVNIEFPIYGETKVFNDF